MIFIFLYKKIIISAKKNSYLNIRRNQTTAGNEGKRTWNCVIIFAWENENCHRTRKFEVSVLANDNKDDFNHLCWLYLKISLNQSYLGHNALNWTAVRILKNTIVEQEMIVTLRYTICTNHFLVSLSQRNLFWQPVTSWNNWSSYLGLCYRIIVIGYLIHDIWIDFRTEIVWPAALILRSRPLKKNNALQKSSESIN